MWKRKGKRKEEEKGEKKRKERKREEKRVKRREREERSGTSVGREKWDECEW